MVIGDCVVLIGVSWLLARLDMKDEREGCTDDYLLPLCRMVG